MRILSLSTDFQASRGLEGEAGVNTGQKIMQAVACLALRHRKPPVKLPGWIFGFGWTIPLIKYAKWQQQLSAVASQLINANIMSWLKTVSPTQNRQKGLNQNHLSPWFHYVLIST